jgi:alpha-L-fucosidase 2
MTLVASYVLLSVSVLMAGDPGTAIPYDKAEAKWLIDPEEMVARNDVLYTTPSAQLWEAMPTGGGDLSAMVRSDGNLHLHLGKSDAWGFRAPPEELVGTRFFNNVSPGHVCLEFGPRGKELAAKRFRQRLDLYHGRIVLELGDEPSGPKFVVWGHPVRKILVVEVNDPSSALDVTKIELSQWRPTMTVGTSGPTVHAREVLTRPARPHLSNTGMQNFFGPDGDPLQGRGIAVVVGCPSVAPAQSAVAGSTATLALPRKRPAAYHVLIAAAVTPSGDPLNVAQREFDEAARIPLATLKAEHDAWWHEYWGRSFLRVTSPDKGADRVCAAYHVHLYTLGCVNRGPYPAKWDGGPGLMCGDERNWGLAEWVQEIRFTYLPLYAANRLDMARGLSRHYTAMIPYLTEQTRKMWGLPGLWIPETELPWGHAEDWLLKDDGRGPRKDYGYRSRTADKIPYGKFDYYNPYIGLLFTSGLEICQHYLTYYRYSGDKAFLELDAYPVIRGVCEFIAGLLRKEADGRYHLDPANALESWWRVRDPADTFSGIRAIFPEFVRLSEKYGRDEELRGRCKIILAALPEPARGLWWGEFDAAKDGKIHAEVDVYAPAAIKDGQLSHPRTNFENPALYRVFPFGLSGIDSSDYALARRTFERRIFSLANGWSMDPIWAARLGLGEEACQLIVQHAQTYQRFRYGGWTSNDNRNFPGGLSITPFLDAGGLSAFALQEILLQSHGGVIRLTPAVAKTWSGLFRLLAEGQFVVAGEFRDGQLRLGEIRSLAGGDCTVANPWRGSWMVCQQGRVLAQGKERLIRLATKPGEVYRIEPAAEHLDAPARP